jgi:heme exporter protein C
MAAMHRFANPTRFVRLSSALLPWFVVAMIGFFAAGLYLGLIVSPPDYQQGDSVRIMYVHVPAATLASGVYVVMAVASAVALIWRHPLADVAAKAAAPVGAIFTLIALITGALWGQPTWGTWWVWDARLTSVLIMLFLYLGYMGLWQAFDDQRRAARAAAILALVGAVNLPIIKFSVDWWNTLHQPASILRAGGPTIHPDLLTPLGLMWGGFLCFFAAVLIIRMQREIVLQRIRALQTLQVATEMPVPQEA